MKPVDAVVERPVVFFHVMKCAGSSVREGLTMGLAGYRDGPEVFELDGNAAKTAAGGTVSGDLAFRDVLLPYVVATQHPAVVLGHFRYRDYHAPLMEAAHLTTVLRDPVERLVSLHAYRRHQPGVVLPVSRDLREQIASKQWNHEGHRYVSTFCGRDDLDPYSEEAIATAVANLRRFAVVGSVERLDDFAARVSALVGAPIAFPVLNTRPALAVTETDPEFMAVMRDLCAADIAVYEQVTGFAS